MSPDVLHGKPRVRGTRVCVQTVGYAVRERGDSVEEVAADYPQLDSRQVEAAVTYYDEHPELMRYIRTQKVAIRAATEDLPPARINGPIKL